MRHCEITSNSESDILKFCNSFYLCKIIYVDIKSFLMAGSLILLIFFWSDVSKLAWNLKPIQWAHFSATKSWIICWLRLGYIGCHIKLFRSAISVATWTGVTPVFCTVHKTSCVTFQIESGQSLLKCWSNAGSLLNLP